MKLTVIRILLSCFLFLITLLPSLQYLSPRTPLRGRGEGAEGTEKCLFLTSQNLFKRYKTKGKENKKNETHMKRRG